MESLKAETGEQLDASRVRALRRERRSAVFAFASFGCGANRQSRPMARCVAIIAPHLARLR